MTLEINETERRLILRELTKIRTQLLHEVESMPPVWMAAARAKEDRQFAAETYRLFDRLIVKLEKTK